MFLPPELVGPRVKCSICEEAFLSADWDPFTDGRENPCSPLLAVSSAAGAAAASLVEGAACGSPKICGGTPLLPSRVALIHRRPSSLALTASYTNGAKTGVGTNAPYPNTCNRFFALVGYVIHLIR
jgi:hypothetical protein